MATSGRYRAGLGGRLGRVPAGLREAVTGREVVWVHAVSVGEVLAAVRLVEEMRSALETRAEGAGAGWVVVVSTTTEAGQRLARQRFGARVVFYLPLDFGLVVRRYLTVVRPRLLVLMESELWPRMLVECERAGVPVAVVNARVSDRSYPRYMRLRRLWRPLLGKVRVFLAQGEESARRLVAMGVPEERVRVTGNLKYDVRVGGVTSDLGGGLGASLGRDLGGAMVEKVRAALAPGAVVVVCGSTLEGEERLLLEAWPEVLRVAPGAVMVLAPRHTDRFERVAGTVRESGFGMVRATELAREPRGIGTGTVFLLDTIGDLAGMYSVASVAFVGGSLVEAGGHNPLEPASFGVPVVMGPSFSNFREIVETMRANDGIRVVSREEMRTALVALVGNPAEAQAMGRRGQAVFAGQAGATARTVAGLMEALGERTVGER